MKNRFLSNKGGVNNIWLIIIFYVFIFIILPILFLSVIAGTFYHCYNLEDSSVMYVNVAQYNFFHVIPDTYLNKVTVYSNSFLNGSRGFLGFDSGFCAFVPDMIIGLIAGFFMFFAYTFLVLVDFLKNLTKGIDILKKGKTINPFERTKYGWLGLVSGAFWKVLVFALFY